MPYHVFRHLSAITAVRPKPNDVTYAYQIPWWLTAQAPWNVVNLELKHLGLGPPRAGHLAGCIFYPVYRSALPFPYAYLNSGL